jgi:oligoribonuclease NrnB/cAMP/cGMP phosphodiesterase (DHH superfamily)
MLLKCFYHSADLDGHCSGALVKYCFPETELIPIDYKDKFPYHRIKHHDTVIMVDFSLPMEDMFYINENTKRFIWIDHHKTAINLYNEEITIDAYLNTKKAGCELTWEFLYPESPMPLFVYLLGRYDVWDHSNDMVLPFQYGMRTFNTDPIKNMGIWKQLMEDDNGFIKQIIECGKHVIEYIKFYEEGIMENAFETIIDGYKALAINHNRLNNRSIYTAQYDIFLTFHRIRNQWRVSLYSEKIDVGLLAKKFGGGGHKGAAGFICQELPFEI